MKQLNQTRSTLRQALPAGAFAVILALTAAQAPAAVSAGTDGAVLLQHNGALSSLGLQSFTENSAAAAWTAIPENAGEWKAVAMDGFRVLFFYAPDSALAVCTLDESGAPVTWLRLNRTIQGFFPVAFEGSHILIQRGTDGELVKIEFDDTGCFTASKTLWKNSLGWAVRGIDANRIVLEHTLTRHVAIWVANPKAPLFRPYHSFTLPVGWQVRDLDGDRILIQQGETGVVKLVELGDGYQAGKYTELVSVNEGWRAVALSQ
jgi:hypothetical protein